MSIKQSLGVLYRRYTPLFAQFWFDCYRAKMSWDKDKIIFIHIPKAAGTSISTAIYGSTLGHIPAKNIIDIFPGIFDSHFSFSISRHPYLRFVSAVNYAKNNYKALKYSPGMPDYQYLSDPLILAKEWLVHQDIESVNYIFRTQSSFVCDINGCIIPDYIASIDDLDNCMREVSKKISRKVSLKHLNISNSNNIQLNNELVDLIFDFYFEDYINFNYEKYP